MSKQSEAKQAQGYTRTLKTCANCKHFTCEVTNHKNPLGQSYTIDRNLRCSIGGFKVNKTATCNLHEQKNTNAENSLPKE